MKRALPRYVTQVTPRPGATYTYFQRGKEPKVRLLDPDEDYDAFVSSYNEALKGGPPKDGKRTFRKLIVAYEASERFKRLEPKTKEDYHRALRYIERHAGDWAVKKLERRHVLQMQDTNSHRYRFANYLVSMMSILSELAIDKGWITHNNARGVKALKRSGPELHRPWTEPEKAQFERDADPLSRLVYELCKGTAQRIGDVLEFKWADIADGGIYLTQNKTGAELFIPFTPRLLAFMETVERKGEYIIAKSLREGMSYHKIAREMRKYRPKGCTIHGLRYTAVEELAEAGCSDDEIAAISGHKSRAMIEKYAGPARQRARARAAQKRRG